MNLELNQAYAILSPNGMVIEFTFIGGNPPMVILFGTNQVPIPLLSIISKPYSAYWKI